MDKTGFYKEKLNEKISSLSAERSNELLVNIVPLLPSSLVKRTLTELNYDLDDYYLAYKDEMIKTLSSTQTIKVKGRISYDS